MKIYTKLILLILCFPILLFAKTQQYKLDVAHSSVSFSIKHLKTITVLGDFKEITGNILFDKKKPKKSFFEGGVMAASVNTKNKKRDNHLRSADFFDVENYPGIHFKTKKIKKKRGQLVLIGDFTIKDVTKSVKIPITILGPKKDDWGMSHIGLKGQFEIDRSDYNLKWNKYLDSGDIVLGNKVQIDLKIEAETTIPGLKTRRRPRGYFFKKKR
jgi:polyisoprenoid-binding protein YceI